MVFKKGHTSWNKGLTKETDERVLKNSLALLRRPDNWEELYKEQKRAYYYKHRKKFNKLSGEYYEKHKNDRDYLLKRKENNKRWVLKNKYKINKKLKKHKKKHLNHTFKSIKYMHKIRFGGNRDKVLERDDWQCQECGMSQEQHMLLFNRGLTIDHKDGNGRYSDKPNNNINNLITLCLRCHGRKEGKLNIGIKKSCLIIDGGVEKHGKNYST